MKEKSAVDFSRDYCREVAQTAKSFYCVKGQDPMAEIFLREFLSAGLFVVETDVYAAVSTIKQKEKIDLDTFFAMPHKGIILYFASKIGRDVFANCLFCREIRDGVIYVENITINK